MIDALVISFDFFFFFNDTATTEIYTLSLHDALPISIASRSPNGTQVSGSNGLKPLRNSSAPLTESDPVVSPWKAWSQYRMRDLPVAYLANLSAASTASVPLLLK